ncbi:MAG: right-handed parallel beta-helix repeat-containing protein, partial [Paenibacillaceae bacterium]|nr:right-handed parallel beta-helix repeat-containing protein [Paenibacillaceae bacterium]
VSIDRGIVVYPGATDVVIRGNYIDNYFPTSGPIKGYFSGVFGSGKAGFERIVIEDNTFDGYCAINFDVLSYSRIAGNVVHVRGYTPIVFMSAAKNIVENNVIDGRNLDGKRKASRGITFNAGLNDTGFPPTEMNYVADNVISYVGDEVTPTNDGEYVLFDSNADSNYTLAMHYGAVADADAGSVTVEGVSWSPDQMKDLYVLIVEGKGLGQYRKVTANDGHTLYLDRDWTVAPDYTSKATVTRFFVKNIVFRNTAQHNKGNNFMVWGDGIGNIMDGNVADTGGSSVIALDMAHPDMFFPSYYNVIRDAVSPNLSIGYSEYGRGSMPRSVGLLGNVIAASTGSALAVNSNTTQLAANAYDNVIERNSVSSAITVAGNAANTVLRQNRILGATRRYSDGGTNTRIVDYPLMPPPAGVYTATYENYVDIRWDGQAGADGYYVMRSETPDSGYIVLNGGQAVTGTVYQDHGVQSQKLYYYKLATLAQAYGQGDASPAAAGFDGAGVYASPLDYSDTAGYRQWSYDDGSGTLAYAVGQWANADGSVALDARTTTISAGSAIRQWTVPRDGKVHLYGFASVLSGDGTGSDFRIMLNDSVLADRSFADRTVAETVYDAHEGDIVRFELSGVGEEKTYASEFAVDYTRSAPIPAMPENGTTDVDATPLFEWTPAGGALSYTFELDDNPDMGSPIAVAAGVTQTQYAYGGTLEPGQTYYWRVTAHNGDEAWESETPPASFTVGAATYRTLFAETYNLQPTGAIPEGYRTSTGNGGTALVKEVPGEYDKSLAVSAPGNNSEPTVSFDLPQTLTSGKYEISWQSMYTGQADLHHSLYFGSGDVPWSSAATGVFAAYGRYYVNWQPANAFAVKPNVWQRIKVAIDMDTRQYAVYVDGQRLQLSNGANTFAFGDTSIRVMTITLPYGRWSGTVYIDDIKVREAVD